MNTSRAFTLIEILVVVAIISILASIAVVNFGEATVRAKVSRSKADLRSITVALESYAVDRNDYPPNPSVPGRGKQQFWGWNVVPGRLTTPVSYMTTLPADPFKEGVSIQRRDDVFSQYAPEALAIPYVGYDYYRIISLGDWLNFWNGTPSPQPVPEWIWVSFVAVNVDVDEKEIEPICSWNHRAFNKYGQWMMFSMGPDLVPWLPVETRCTLPTAEMVHSPLSPPFFHSFDTGYDPTNGTTSFGNILRTQKGEKNFATKNLPPGIF